MRFPVNWNVEIMPATESVIYVLNIALFCLTDYWHKTYKNTHTHTVNVLLVPVEHQGFISASVRP